MKNKSRSDHLRISHVVCLAVLTCATAELDTLHPPHWNQPPRGALATVKLPLQTGSLFFSVMWVNWKSILYWRRDSTKERNSKLHGSKLMHSWWEFGGAAEMAEPRNERERRKWLLKEFWKKQRISETKRWNDRKERKRGKWARNQVLLYPYFFWSRNMFPMSLDRWQMLKFLSCAV